MFLFFKPLINKFKLFLSAMLNTADQNYDFYLFYQFKKLANLNIYFSWWFIYVVFTFFCIDFFFIAYLIVVPSVLIYVSFEFLIFHVFFYTKPSVYFNQNLTRRVNIKQKFFKLSVKNLLDRKFSTRSLFNFFNSKLIFNAVDFSKHFSTISLSSLNINFLRKSKVFNKGRYSRNRQNYRTGFYWSVYVNLIAVFGLYYWFYKLTIKFTYLWIFFYFFLLVFIFSRAVFTLRYYSFLSLIFWPYFLFYEHTCIFSNQLFRATKQFWLILYYSKLFFYIDIYFSLKKFLISFK